MLSFSDNWEGMADSQIAKALQPYSPVAFVLHGETAANDKDIVRGWGDYPITPEGKANVAVTAQLLRGGLPKVTFDRIFTSDLARAVETAQILSDITGLPVDATPGLRSWNAGKLSGEKVKDVKDDLQYYFEHPDDHPSDGESINSWLERFIPAERKIRQRPSPSIMVSHGKCLRAIQADLLSGAKLSPDKVDREIIQEPRFKLDHGSAVLITPEGRLHPLGTSESFKITKLDSDQQLVFGFANVSIAKNGQGFYDLQKDFIPPIELEKAAYDHVLHFREADEMHEGNAIGRLVESMVFTPDKLEKFCTDPVTGEVNQADLTVLKRVFPPRWWVGYKLNKPAFEGVKSGKYKMFSIAGEADREVS